MYYLKCTTAFLQKLIKFLNENFINKESLLSEMLAKVKNHFKSICRSEIIYFAIIIICVVIRVISQMCLVSVF